MWQEEALWSHVYGMSFFFFFFFTCHAAAEEGKCQLAPSCRSCLTQNAVCGLQRVVWQTPARTAQRVALLVRARARVFVEPIVREKSSHMTG